MAQPEYHLHLRGKVGGWTFDSEYIDYRLQKLKGKPVNIIIDSRGGSVIPAMSILNSFRHHGNVSVHYVGYNASAATIVSMGAKHVSIDKDAMYLVHKASTFVFEFASMNEDEIAEKIKELQNTQRELIKIDHNIAGLYASKCKKPKDQLLALMKEGGWLTPQEALEWGFVDEITNNEDDKREATDNIINFFASEGNPLPEYCISKQDNLLKKIIDKVSSALSSVIADSKQKISNMKYIVTNICAWLGIAEITGALTQTQVETIEEKIVELKDSLKAKEDEVNNLTSKVADLENEIKDLKDKPAGKSEEIIDPQPHNSKNEPKNEEFEDYIDSIKKAQDLLNSIPH